MISVIDRSTLFVRSESVSFARPRDGSNLPSAAGLVLYVCREYRERDCELLVVRPLCIGIFMTSSSETGRCLVLVSKFEPSQSSSSQSFRSRHKATLTPQRASHDLSFPKSERALVP